LASYFAPKWYALDEMETIAGVSRRAKKIRHGTWEVKIFERLQSAICHPNAPEVIVSHTEYVRKDGDMVGKWDKNGFHIPPVEHGEGGLPEWSKTVLDT
jgi:hypothetical protein